MKYKGLVQQITNPAAYAIGNVARIWIQSQYHIAIGDRWGQITFSPTWQKFPHAHGSLPVGDLDAYFKFIRDSGKEIIGCVANGFNKQYNVALKSLPKDNPTLDKTNPASYSIYTKLLEQFVLRYGSVRNDALIDIADYGNLPSNPQSKVSGLNLINYVQILNEVNWYSGADPEQVLTGKQYALLFDYWCEKIWAIDPNMKVITAPTAKFDQAWLADFYINSRARWESRCDISANIYTFGGCGVWGRCDAIKPEDTDLIERFNHWLFVNSRQGWIAEFGVNSEKMSDLGYPEYGLDPFQSQAKYAIDYTNIALSKSNIKGVTLYKLADDDETRFAKTGLRYKHSTDPPAKPSFQIVKDAFEQPTQPPNKEKIEVEVAGDLSKFEISFE